MSSPQAKKLLGARLKLARTRLGLTREDVASRLGYTFYLIKQWESGNSAPNALRLPAIGDLLQVDVRWLVGIPGAPGPDSAPVQPKAPTASPLSEERRQELRELRMRQRRPTRPIDRDADQPADLAPPPGNTRSRQATGRPPKPKA